MLKNFQSFNEARELLDVQFIKYAFADLIDEGAIVDGGSTYLSIFVNMPSSNNLKSMKEYKDHYKKLGETIEEIDIAIKRIEDELGISAIIKRILPYRASSLGDWALKIIYTLYPEEEEDSDIIPF